MADGRRLRLATAVGVALVAGCSILAPADPRLCSAAQNLSAAMVLTQAAISADAAGDVARAQGLATQARSLGELAVATLQHMPDPEHSKPTWQALVDAYGHVGQAANSLLPAYNATHGSGPAEWDLASRSMAKAQADLPPMCFDIPPDLETPGPS